MSCDKIDDLEDLAYNLFEFQEDDQRQPRRERTLKKQRKPKTTNDSTTIEDKDEELIQEHVHGNNLIYFSLETSRNT